MVVIAIATTWYYHRYHSRFNHHRDHRSHRYHHPRCYHCYHRRLHQHIEGWLLLVAALGLRASRILQGGL